VSDLHDALDFHGIRGAAIHPGVLARNTSGAPVTQARAWMQRLVSNNRSSFSPCAVSMPLTAAEAGAAPAGAAVAAGGAVAAGAPVPNQTPARPLGQLSQQVSLRQCPLIPTRSQGFGQPPPTA